MNHCLRWIAVAALLGFGCVASGQDWNQWRGANRDGALSSGAAPAEWPAEFKPSWEVDVGEGYSSPVIDDSTVYVHARVDPDEIVWAIDLKSGATKWKQSYPAAFSKNQYAKDMAKGPNATPLVADGRLFTIGVTGVLTAWDAATGKSLWGNNYSSSVDTSKLFYGTSASPILVDGRLIVHVGSDVHGGQVLALDPETGREIWKWTGTGPGYSSPIIIEIAGTRQFINMTDSSVIGIDIETGKELWSIPFPDEWQENIVTPLWTGSLLVISGTRQGTHAYKLEQSGAAWKPTQAWENREVAMYMSSPVLGDGLIYGHSVRRKGQFVALDPDTGEVRWASPGRDAEHAGVVLARNDIVFLTDDARLIVVERGTDEFRPRKTYQLAQSKTWALPVFIGGDVLVRDEARLIRLTGRP